MKIVFFGPPGSGKGTQAKLLASQFNIVHLSTGDILREKLKEKDDLSIQLKEIMSSGNLVSDKLLNQIITEKLNSRDCIKGFILDGYPRTTHQSDFFLSFLDQKKMQLDYVFDFQINLNLVKKRILFRSKQEKRSDDNLHTIKTRIDKYMSDTHPVSEYFSTKFKSIYFKLDASKEISNIQKELIKTLKNGHK
tara:strand:- start:51 stop:629 length:579 start_codon:yes stop_codon:yes gene_type:complete